MEIFYRATRPHTFVDNESSQSLLESNSQTLALVQTVRRSRTLSISSIDFHNSPCSLITSNRRTQFNFSPCGHISDLGIFPLGFNGERFDHAGGFYLLGNGYRGYHPTLMRFMAPDSLSPFDEGGPNSYAYAANDPTNRIDPTGHYYGKAKIISGNLTTFYDRNFWGKKRELRIVSHGDKGWIQAGNDALNATGLTALLKENGIKTTKLKTRIYSCSSATTNNATGTSLIEDYANLNGVKTTGFDGEIITGYRQFQRLNGDTRPTISFNFEAPNPRHKNPNKRYQSHTPITVRPTERRTDIRS
ncbi:MAG: RHS repeat-associated core domain-containing protein [Pseudomonas sp.]|uniref:RHS repeat-associated core domain-containing protein n=1 Tax=Pseudomonas TaxID=286 RepID=UPI0003C08746|nr:hypothetical protein PVLB_03755 [Pseudomonas sp. VLB120]